MDVRSKATIFSRNDMPNHVSTPVLLALSRYCIHKIVLILFTLLTAPVWLTASSLITPPIKLKIQ